MNDTRIYLCEADGSILGIPTGIKTDTCNLKRSMTDFWEITFEVERFINIDGELVQSNFYDSIDDSMRLYLDSDATQAYFIIDEEPTVKGEGYQETKTVTAHSVESELNHIYLKNFKVNCGTYDSQEFLVTDEKGDLVNNVNAYNAETMRWIKLVDYTDTRYSLMHLVLENTDWTIKDDIPEEICNIQKTYETSNSIYAFLMKSVSPTAHVIFDFDKKNKQIGIANMDTYGKDTGVFVTMRNLMNSFEITSSADDAIMTKLIPVGANNLGIEQVNFGESHIINLDYFMNTFNEYGDYKFVSKDLHDKYVIWRNFRDDELVEYTFEDREKDKDFKGTRRELYRELTKEYNKYYMTISELTSRVPNDGCSIDYKKFTLEELKTSYTAYNNALDALRTLYKNEIIEEYGLNKDTIIIINDDYSLSFNPEPSTPISPTLLPDTPYWYDYYAYTFKIIPQVEECLKMYCKTDENKNLIVENGHFIEMEGGNPDYYKDTTIVTDVDAWQYEWSLYGLSELESKKKAWGEVASLLYKDCFEISKGVYLEANDDSWNSLSDSDKTLFTSKDAFLSDLNKYLDYVSYDETRDNSLTKQKGKGIIRQCEDAIADRLSEIENLAKLQDNYDTDRKELVKSVAMRKFFTDEDILIINGILRTKDYENNNILTTNLNTIITTVDVQEELYQEAIKELDKISQPQYSFKTELDNLYYLEEFKAYREPFDVGNFIRVGLEIHEDLYDNNYIKLRVISISHNPLEYTEDLSIEFSTMTKSLNTISDLAFFLDEQSSISSGGSSSTSSGGGTYGNNDASVQMSTTMLNALLKTETFGTAVSDVILDTMKANKGDFNSLFAHSGVFDSLEAGQIKVSGDCLFDRIKSSNWNGTENNLLGNTQGSILDLSNGGFNFGGGKIKYDSISNEMIMQGVTIKWDSTNPPKTSDISGLEEYLNQLDGRIQTYSQATDPSTSWTATEKSNNIGDLWFDTQNSLTKRWNGSSWDTVTDSELETLAKSKAQIFTTTPTTPYYVGDLWVQGSSGDIMNCIKTRTSGSYATSDWGKSSKYTDDAKANSAYNLANSAKGVAENAKAIGDNLVTGLGFQETEITGQYVISPVIAGGTLLIGDTNGTYAQIATDGKLTCTGANIDGRIHATSLTLDGTLPSSKISGLSSVATSGKYSDLSDKPTIPDSLSDLTDGANVMHFSDITFGTPTTSNGVTTQTITYKDSSGNSHNYTNKYSADGSYLLTNVGKGTGTWSNSTDASEHENNYFLVTTDGLLKANNAIIYGDIYASNGRFSGDVIANTLTANTKGTIAGWTFDENGFYKNSNEIGNKEGFYIGENGISIGDYFVIDNDGVTIINPDYQNVIYEDSLENIQIYNGISFINAEIDNSDSFIISLQDCQNEFYLTINYIAIASVGVSNSDGSTMVALSHILNYVKCHLSVTNNTVNFIDSDESIHNECIKNITLNTNKDCLIEIDCTFLNEYKNPYQPVNNFISWNTELIYLVDINTSQGVDNISVSQQIKSVHIYSEDKLKDWILNGKIKKRFNGLVLDTASQEFYGDEFTLTPNGMYTYGDFNYVIYEDFNNSEMIYLLNKNSLYHKGLETSSSGNTLVISSDGQFLKKSSSSQRYKNTIQSIDKTAKSLSDLSPHNLYDIDVVSYRYNDDYLSKTDQRYQKDITGFIAEDVYEKYPIACNLDKEGKPEMWNIDIMFPAALKLIQEQHEDIEKLKEEIERLKKCH